MPTLDPTVDPNPAFSREPRYLVLKLTDIAAALSPEKRRTLDDIAAKVEAHRRVHGKEPLACVVVEADWPEYEPTWAAIEARVRWLRLPTLVERLRLEQAEQPAQQDGPINDGWQITVAHGHSGYGVYAHMEDYPEEGAVLIQAIEQPAQQQPMAECERCGQPPSAHTSSYWCDNQSFKLPDGSVQLGASPQPVPDHTEQRPTVPVRRDYIARLSRALKTPGVVAALEGDTAEDALVELACMRLERPAQQEPVADMDELVNRFLAWPLPVSVCADPCTSQPGYSQARFGTSFLTAPQARQMLEHVLQGVALYPAPPKREPLTDEQIETARKTVSADPDDLPEPWAFKSGWRAAEAAHDIPPAKSSLRGTQADQVHGGKGEA